MIDLSLLHRFPNARAAAEGCGGRIVDLLRQAIAERGVATLAISGGSSPKPMFESFARTEFPWDRVHLYWVDERCVPPTDSQSNFKLASDTWLTPGKFPLANVHRIEAELAPDEAARLYIEDIRASLQLNEEEQPRFDVIHRGMGPDGHTASLFPESPLIGDRTRIAAGTWVEKMRQWRVTLLPATLESARHTVMLVTGHDKAKMLHTVLEGAYDPNLMPVQIASRADSPGGPAEWFLDDDAAAKL